MKGNRFHATHQIVGYINTRHGRIDVWKFSYFADDLYNGRAKFTGRVLQELNRERGVGIGHGRFTKANRHAPRYEF